MAQADERPFSTRSLVERLQVRELADDEFVGDAPVGYHSRVYGGHILAQALASAARTVPGDRPVLSLHAYFLRPGDPSADLRYGVGRMRDGRSISARAVDVVQGTRVLASVRAAFMRVGAEEPTHEPMPAVPGPEELPPLHVRRGVPGAAPDGFNWVPDAEWARSSRPLDIRYVEPGSAADRRCFWFRSEAGARTATEDNVVLAFASDRSLLPTILHARGELRRHDHIPVASVDHAMWFHASVPAGEWCLYVQESEFGSSGLGLARGKIYASTGALVASVVQQGILSRPSV
ncbi:thioesterase family protein [Nocardioides sp. NBC_00368]|uniref:acyl-CoA thioesterase n=1 Tax=Nocardioides sp. NBC_00368 TaxID=2976000 RepID=UPI002E1DAAEE